MADLTGKTIADLPLDDSINGEEIFPVMDGSTSKKVPMKSVMLTAGGVQGDNRNIDELLEPATYWFSPSVTITGNPPPVNQHGFKMIVSRAYLYSGTPRLWQIVNEVAYPFREHRRYYSGSAWSAWETLDVSAVNTKLSALGDGNISFSRVSITAGNNVDFPLANSTHGILFFTGINPTSVCGLYAVFCASTGAVYYREIAAASSIALTASTNTLNIANNAETSTAFALFLSY